MTVPTSFEVKKMKQGMSYSGKEKTIILNVFKYFRTQYPDKTVTEIVRRTAKATGCSEKSIFSFRKEEVSPQGFREPSKRKIRKKMNINSRLNKYNENVREAIKNIIYELKNKNIVPSLSTILKNINTNDALPNFSIMTLRRLLSDMGFYYEKNGSKSVLVEIKKESKQISKSMNSKKPLHPKQPITANNVAVDTNGSSEGITNSYLANNSSETFNKVPAVIKLNHENIQVYSHMNNHPNHRIQAFGSYQENHFLNSNSYPPAHAMPVMFAPRMPPYHVHSSVPPPNQPPHVNTQKRRDGPFAPHHPHPHGPHFSSHNVILH